MTEGFCRYSRCPEWYYRLFEETQYKTPFRPEAEIETAYAILKTNGILIGKAEYGWNGPSGVPKKFHTGGMIYGALAHDILYGLMCDGLLSRSKASRKMADGVLKSVMQSSGSWLLTSWVFFAAVRCKGRDYANPRSLNEFKEILVAPK